MRNAIVMYPVRGRGYAFAISFPKFLVESFKDLFERQNDRAWQNPLWCFKRSSLQGVRAWAMQQTQEHPLALHDLTAMRKAQREQLEASIRQSEYEEHVAALVELLPQLPASALRLAHWWPSHLALDLQTRLERSLFDQLVQAALPPGQVPQTPYIFQQKSSDSRFFAAPDPRILRVLMGMSVGNFGVQDLSLVQSFENGAAHFYDQEGKLWFGAPYQAVIGSSSDFMSPENHHIPLPYAMATAGEESVYLVAPAQTYLQLYCQSVAPAIFSSMEPRPPSEAFMKLLQHFRLEAWLRAHVNELCSAPFEALIPRTGLSHATLWRDPRFWMHPADALLHYLQLSDGEVLLLLGWNTEQFRAVQDQVQQLKIQRAEAYFQYCEVHAVDLMQERLLTLQRTEIQELAGRYRISIPLRTKEKMIRACVDTRMAADLIGVTEERHRRADTIDFSNGIPWGKRISSDLHDYLRRGYLSDGTWTIGCLKKDESSAWYALWEGWPPQTRIASHQWSPYTFIEQRNMDLGHCRWFAYPRGEMPKSEEKELEGD